MLRPLHLISLVLALAVAGLAGCTTGTAPPTGAPVASQQIPDFTLPLLGGGEATLSELRAEKPVVLVFYRGHW